MGIKLSEKSIAKLKEQSFTEEQISEIEYKAASLETVEIVAGQAFLLRGNNFISARIIDFACSAAPTDVVEKVIHDSGKMQRAELDNNQITALAMHAATKQQVDYMLTLAHQAKEGGTKEKADFKSAFELMIPKQQNQEPVANATAETKKSKPAQAL